MIRIFESGLDLSMTSQLLRYQRSFSPIKELPELHVALRKIVEPKTIDEESGRLERSDS